MFKIIYEKAKAESAYPADDFPAIQDIFFRFFPQAWEGDRIIGPAMVRLIRNWPGNRLDGEVLGDVNLD